MDAQKIEEKIERDDFSTSVVDIIQIPGGRVTHHSTAYPADLRSHACCGSTTGWLNMSPCNNA